LSQHDSYYHDLAHLPLERRRRVNFDHPDMFDSALFITYLDTRIRGGLVAILTYDFVSYVGGTETMTVAPEPV
jgi:uridine kinase